MPISPAIEPHEDPAGLLHPVPSHQEAISEHGFCTPTVDKYGSPWCVPLWEREIILRTASYYSTATIGTARISVHRKASWIPFRMKATGPDVGDGKEMEHGHRECTHLNHLEVHLVVQPPIHLLYLYGCRSVHSRKGYFNDKSPAGG